MKKRIHNETFSYKVYTSVSYKKRKASFRCFLNDTCAWIDLILSKTALIFATMIILMAVYSLAGSSSDLVKKDELETVTVDLVSGINAAGCMHPESADSLKVYSFDMHSERLIGRENLNILVSGEYVVCTYEDNGRNITSARALSYRTLPFSPSELGTMLSGYYGSDGSVNHPLYSDFPYTGVTDFLSAASAEGLYLNASKDVCFEKKSVFVTDGSEVNELEYVLVYQ